MKCLTALFSTKISKGFLQERPKKLLWILTSFLFILLTVFPVNSQEEDDEKLEDIPLPSLQLNSAETNLAISESVQLALTGIWPDGSTRDLTDSIAGFGDAPAWCRSPWIGSTPPSLCLPQSTSIKHGTRHH